MSHGRPQLYLAQTYRIPDTSQCVHLTDFLYLKASATVHVSVQVPSSSRHAEEAYVRAIRQQIVDYVDPDQLIWCKAVKGAPGFVRFEAEFATVRGMRLGVQQLDKWSLHVPESGGGGESRRRSHALKVRAAAARHQFPARRVWQRCCEPAGAAQMVIPHAFYLRGMPKRWFPAGGCGAVVKRAFSHWGEVLGVDVTAGPVRTGTLNLRVRYQSHDGFQGAMAALMEARVCYWNTSEPWIAPITVDLGDRHAPDDGQRRWPDFLPAPSARRMPPPGVDTDPDSSPLPPPSSHHQRHTDSSTRKSRARSKSADRRRQRKSRRRRRRRLHKQREKERLMERRIEREEVGLVDSQRKLEAVRLLDILLKRVLVERRKVVAELRLSEAHNYDLEQFALQEELEEKRMQKELKLRDKIVCTYVLHEEKQLAVHKENLLRAMKGKRQLKRDIADLDKASSNSDNSSRSSSMSSNTSSSSSSTSSSRSSSSVSRSSTSSDDSSASSASSARDSRKQRRRSRHKSRRDHRRRDRRHAHKQDSSYDRSRSRSAASGGPPASSHAQAYPERSPSLVGTPPPPDPRMAFVRGRGGGGGGGGGNRWGRAFQPRMRGRGFAPLLYDADGNDLCVAGGGGGGMNNRRGSGGRGGLRGFNNGVRGRGADMMFDQRHRAHKRFAGGGEGRFYFKRRRGGSDEDGAAADDGSDSGGGAGDDAGSTTVVSRVWNKNSGWVDRGRPSHTMGYRRAGRRYHHYQQKHAAAAPRRYYSHEDRDDSSERGGGRSRSASRSSSGSGGGGGGELRRSWRRSGKHSRRS